MSLAKQDVFLFYPGIHYIKQAFSIESSHIANNQPAKSMKKSLGI
jgi:hypothetical protein